MHGNQNRLDGHEVSHWQARFGGSFDIDEDTAEALNLDRRAVMIVSSKADGADFKIIEETGEVRRKNVLKVEDCIVLDGDLREQAIMHLHHGGTQGRLSFPQHEATETDARITEILANVTAALHELGEPGTETPAPISNAVDLLNEIIERNSSRDLVDPETGEISTTVDHYTDDLERDVHEQIGVGV